MACAVAAMCSVCPGEFRTAHPATSIHERVYSQRMWQGKKISWHRPNLSMRLEGKSAVLDLDGDKVHCAFPLEAQAEGKTWALGVPVDQLRQPEVDIYVFEAQADGNSLLLTQAPEAGFEAVIRSISTVE